MEFFELSYFLLNKIKLKQQMFFADLLSLKVMYIRQYIHIICTFPFNIFYFIQGVVVTVVVVVQRYTKKYWTSIFTYHSNVKAMDKILQNHCSICGINIVYLCSIRIPFKIKYWSITKDAQMKWKHTNIKRDCLCSITICTLMC